MLKNIIMPKKIMVVDDENNLRELVRLILENEGYEVITAIDGNDCLEKLKDVKPDLVLVDMMMPNMSGRELCEKIRSNPKTKRLKLAFLTVAILSETGKDTLRKMRVLDYIEKPFVNRDLVSRVKKMVG
jgi:CheY-like chemotaxis protein